MFQLRFSFAIMERQPYLPGMLCLTLNPGKQDLGLVELSPHAGLGEIHKMLRIVHYYAIYNAISQPGVQPQGARLGVIIPAVVGDIQVYLIRQALNLPFRTNPVVMNKEQIDISCPP